MPARKVPAAPLHDLPATVEFTLADGTRLTAAVRLSTRSRRAKLSLTPRGGLVLTIPLTMGPAQLQSSLPLFLPWLERARTTLLRRVPAPQLPPSITLPLTGEFFAVVPGGDMAAGRKAATRKPAKLPRYRLPTVHGVCCWWKVRIRCACMAPWMTSLYARRPCASGAAKKQHACCRRIWSSLRQRKALPLRVSACGTRAGAGAVAPACAGAAPLSP